MAALGRLGVREVSGGWSWKFDWRCLSVTIPPVWEQLARLRTPALLARGELTTIVSREDFARLVKALPGARGVEFPGAHHHVPLDAPEALAAEIARFAAGLSA
jgi:pimeloyl-ACP methyl ester carboxylesterase